MSEKSESINRQSESDDYSMKIEKDNFEELNNRIKSIGTAFTQGKKKSRSSESILIFLNYEFNPNSIQKISKILFFISLFATILQIISADLIATHRKDLSKEFRTQNTLILNTAPSMYSSIGSAIALDICRMSREFILPFDYLETFKTTPLINCVFATLLTD